MMRQNYPLISVIVTCYNIRQYVAQALGSVLAQSYPNIEVIVVDDGSTDDTQSVLAPFLSYPRVRCVTKENGGPSSARNRGIGEAAGDFIAFLDGDDLWHPEKLARQVAALEENPAVGVVFCDFSTFDTAGSVAEAKNASLFRHLEPVGYNFLVSRSNFIYPSTVLLPRAVFDQCGVFDESLRGPEDYDMWLRVARQFQVVGLRESLVSIRQHPCNLSKNVTGMIANERRVIEKQHNYLSATAYRRRLAKLFFLNADRSIHAGNRPDALRLLIQGVRLYPFVYVDLLVVLIKLLLGGRRTESIRRRLNNSSLGRSLFETIYKRY